MSLDSSFASFVGLVPMRLALPALGLLLATASAHAQCSEVAIQTGNFVCPPPGINGAWGAVAAGDIDGDLTTDIAVIRGTTLMLFCAPAVLESAILLSFDAVDVCYCPDVAGVSKPGFLYTTSQGLRRVTVVAGAALDEAIDPAASPNPYVNARLEYLGATKQIVGVKSDKRSVFTAAAAGSSFQEPTVHFTLAQDVLAFAPMNWDDGVPAVALLRASGVQIRRLAQNGPIVVGRSTLAPGAPEALAVVSKPNMTDALAWLTDVGDGHQSIVLFVNAPSGEPLYQEAVSLGTGTWTVMESADVDGDGSEDLVLNPGGTTDLRTVLNQAPIGSWESASDGPAFAGASGTIVPMAEGLEVSGAPYLSSGDCGQLVCTDLYNDRSDSGALLPGFAVVLHDLDGLRLVPNPDALQARQQNAAASTTPPPEPDFDSAAWRLTGECAASTLGTCSDPQSVWTSGPGEWEIELGGGWGEPAAVTHIELIVREQQPGVNPTPAAIHHWFFCKSDAGSIAGTTLRFLGLPGELQSEGTGEDTVYFDDTRYYALVRPVKRTGNHIDQAWRWSILSLTGDCEQYGVLTQQNGAGYPLQELGEPCGEIRGCGGSFAPLTVGSRLIPSPVPQSRIPGPMALPTAGPANF